MTTIYIRYISIISSCVIFIFCFYAKVLGKDKEKKRNEFLQTFVDNSAICAGSEIEVKYNTNVISAEFAIQISDENGSFARSPLSIGRITGVLGRTSGGTKARLPFNLKQGNKYRIRTLATDPYFEGTDNGVDIIIKPAPTVGVEIIGSINLCEGETMQLKAISSVNSYLWSNGQTSQSITVSEAGIYRVTVKDRQTECEVSSGAIQITKNQIEKPKITSNGLAELCVGNYLELNTPLLEGINYEWQRNGKKVGAFNSRALLVFEPGEYTVTIANKCASATSAPFLVSLKALVPPPACAPVSRCGEGKVVLKARGGEEGRYQWYDENFYPIKDANKSEYITPTHRRKATYYVANERFGCVSEKIQVDVFIRPPATPVDAGKDIALILGESVQLNALMNTPLAQTTNIEANPNGRSANLRYEWSPATYLDNASIPNPTATPQESITYTVKVIIDEGCEVIDDVKVIVRRELKIPNGFTPNGDGVNDTWEIANIAFQPDAVVEVFDRWGNRIFHSQGYSKQWDGTFNGQPLPTHTYFYVITAENGKQKWTGALNVLR
jgi:gliding motility-associated-like protein